jgi:hypothetical protein
VEEILDGEEPFDFSLEQLRNNLPLDWAEQRKQFGLPPGRNARIFIPVICRTGKVHSLIDRENSLFDSSPLCQ